MIYTDKQTADISVCCPVPVRHYLETKVGFIEFVVGLDSCTVRGCQDIGV